MAEMTMNDKDIQFVEIDGFDETTQDDVLESFEHYLANKRKLVSFQIQSVIKDFRAYMEERRYEEKSGANVGMSDSDYETDR